MRHILLLFGLALGALLTACTEPPSAERPLPTATAPTPAAPTPVLTIRVPPSPTPPPTAAPALAATPAAAAAPTVPPLPSPTPTPEFGRSAAGRPLTAVPIGDGPFKIVVAANNVPELAELADRLSPIEGVTLWLVPDLNPDGGDVLYNADTNDDGCAGNNWSQRADDFPFSRPEARALRTLADDAHIVLLLHAGDTAGIRRDACRDHAATERLAQTLRDALNVPILGNDGIAGALGDYFAGEGIAAVHLSLAGRDDVAAAAAAAIASAAAARDAIVAAEADAFGAPFGDLAGADRFAFAPGTFIHPLALAHDGDRAFLLDGGRVIAADLSGTVPPQVWLRPGDEVDGVRVLEPIDLAVDGNAVYVLDRAGDVYRRPLDDGPWTVDRYDRPVRDLSSHYYVALAATPGGRVLVETSYRHTLLYGADTELLWNLPDERGVDVAVGAGGVYVLTEASLTLYRDTALVEAFRPNITLRQPLATTVLGDRVYVLDQYGRRLLVLSADRGLLRAIYVLPDRGRMTALGNDGTRVFVAQRDRLLALDGSGTTVQLPPGETLTGPQPHDLAYLAALPTFSRPIVGTDFPVRDFQLPGAPRHYRLGIHEGFDFYWQSGTQVVAAADGVVIRATHNYVPPAPAEFALWRERSLALGYTSPEAHDFYRGRQVWIEHEGGFITRYVHLSSIDPAVVEGATVTRGQVIARVGNSGSPGSLESEESDAHLHFELRLGDGYVGQFLRPTETRLWVRRLLP